MPIDRKGSKHREDRKGSEHSAIEQRQTGAARLAKSSTDAGKEKHPWRKC